MAGDIHALADEFAGLWSSEPGVPDVWAFLSRYPDATPRAIVEVVLVDQRRRQEAGCPLPAEHYLAGLPAVAADPELKLDIVYGEYCAARDAGHPIDPGALSLRFPDLAEAIRQHLDMDFALGDSQGADRHNDTGNWESDEAAPGSPGVGRQRPRSSEKVPDVGAGTVLVGRYKLLEPIGEGGMGAVWTAQQSEPVRRLVAIKVVRSGLDSKSVLARFEAERQALAMMDHPNIARVFDAGTTDGGRPFFVMELVKGVPITEFCDQRRLTPRQRLDLFVPVCLAIQHAHQKGIIHRDIKPTNVLVALHDDRPVPKVIDFGVAKATGTPLTEKTLNTGFEQVVGTPVYMSPEQATFNQLDIDTRSDVYSLGVLLYELLTGTTPIEQERFRKAALLEVLRLVREEEPPRPSTRLSSTTSRASIAAVRATEPARLSKLFRGELDWIAMKALEKDRSRRYETANALARDVQRYLADEVVEARPPSLSYRMRKFVRRYKVPVTAIVIVLLGLVGGVIGTAYGVVKAQSEREAIELRDQAEQARDAAEESREAEHTAKQEAEAARKDVERQREKLARVEYGRTIEVAHQEWRENNLAGARTLLEGTRTDLRSWEWHYVNRLCHSELLTLSYSDSGIPAAVFSPDGKRIFARSKGGALRVFDSRTGESLGAFLGYDNPVIRAAMALGFSPGWSRLVTGGWDEMIRVWDAKTGRELSRFQEVYAPGGRAEFSPDGSRIVIVNGLGEVAVRDATSGTVLLRLKLKKERPWSASFSPDGSRIVTGNSDHTSVVWDAKHGDKLLTLKGHRDTVFSAAFSPDGSRIITASADRTAKVWDAKTGTELLTLNGHTAGLGSARFSSDGSLAVTASGDKTARVWSVKTGNELLILRGHTDGVLAASFSPDGSRVVTVSHDLTARVWDATVGPEAAIFHLGDVSQEFTRTGVSAWLGPDGLRTVTVNSSNLVTLWDQKSGARRTLNAQGSMKSAALSADGSRVVTTGSINNNFGEAMEIWDIATGKRLKGIITNGHSAMGPPAFSPDGSRVVTASEDMTTKLWDAKTGNQLLTLNGHTSHLTSTSFSPDGSRIVAGAKVWDSATGAELVTLKEKAQLDWVAGSFSPDGSRIVTGHTDGTAKVWDAKTGHELLRLRGHTSTVEAASFSPDGARIVTGSNDRTVKVWDSASGAELLTLKKHTGKVASVTFSLDGSRIVTTSWDGTARVWDSRLLGQPPGKGPLKGDAIEVAEVKPAAPATLKAGEKLEVRFLYSLESADQVVILVHPTTKNKYSPHPVSAFKKGQGKGVGWLVFNGPAAIEEIQIRMVDLKAKKTLVVVKHQVKAQWK